MEIIKSIQHFVAFWYLRYLLVTELYMVDDWERVIVHILFAVLFGLFWYFNYSIVTTCIAQLRSTTLHEIQQII